MSGDEAREAICAWVRANGLRPEDIPEDALITTADGQLAADRVRVNPQRPTAMIQWKGTDVCLDLHCACGRHCHFDGGFAYELRCAYCGRVWTMPTTVALTEGDQSNEHAHVVWDSRDEAHTP